MTALQDDQALASRAADLHQRAIVIDGQAVRIVDPSLSLSGGATAVVLTLEQRDTDDFTLAAKQMARQLNFLEYYKDQVLLVRTTDDIERAKREGKLGLIFGFQTTAPVGDDVSLLSVFHVLGVRYTQLTYMNQTLTGSGCLEPHDTGLTAFGRIVIREMERLGILLDLSHVGRRTSLEALAYAQAPCVFSHSNPAAVFEMPRNITDEQIRAVAATGGLVGVTPCVPFFCGPEDPRPTVSDVITHVAYVANLVGIDHVALGTDAPEGGSAWSWATSAMRIYAETIPARPLGSNHASGFATRADFPNVTLEMARRGFSDDDILKVLGGNWMRVYRAVWGR